MGIPCLGPDVNESQRKFSANKKGEIRFGLSAIKGMGDAAAINIIEEREKNGPYKDIYDFVQRVNLSAVNRKALESLALSGGLDSFGIRRESYFGETPKGTFIEILLRYGQTYQQEQNQMQNSRIRWTNTAWCSIRCATCAATSSHATWTSRNWQRRRS